MVLLFCYLFFDFLKAFFGVFHSNAGSLFAISRFIKEAFNLSNDNMEDAYSKILAIRSDYKIAKEIV
jgi:hypothetical protein